MARFILRLLVAIVLAQLSLSSLSAQERFRIGPYPVPFDQGGLQGTLNAWVDFDASVYGRGGEGGYELRATLTVQLDDIASAVGRLLARDYPQDNCGRYSVDNWVYSFPTHRFEVVDDKSLLLYVKGDVETWSCARNPIPETYWDDTGCTCFGIGGTTCGCPKTRPGSPIKIRNFQQGVEGTQYTRIVLQDEKTIRLNTEQPIFTAIGMDLGSQFVNFIAFFTYNLPAMMRNVFAPDFVQAQMPPDFLVFSPRFSGAKFYRDSAGQHLIEVVGSVRISLDEINAFMTARFPATWKRIPSPAVRPAETDGSVPPSAGDLPPWPSKVTKQFLRAFCPRAMPADSLEDCAAAGGFRWDALPEN